jgi:hypothetical protein
LKKADKFIWDDEAQKAFEALKESLTKPLVMTPPIPKETLLLYISTTTNVVSTVLVAEREEEGQTYPVQRPVYYTLHTTLEAALCAPDHVEKASTLLPRSQDRGPVFVPLRRDRPQPRHQWPHHQVVNQAWRVQNRVLPRQAIKSQILADFVSEWIEIQMPPPKERPEHWIMYFDGALNLEGAGAGVLLISP